jgi:glutamate-5-semialdehyde dehydrogenase
LTIDHDFANSLQPGDSVLAIASSGVLRRIPSEVSDLVDTAVGQAVNGFRALALTSSNQVDTFFRSAAELLSNDEVFEFIKVANTDDVAVARQRGRSTTRLELDQKMRIGMIEAFRLWESTAVNRSSLLSTTQHAGWRVEERTSPLGVIGFVFEGRPNVFADATGVLKSGNTVVFRIGSDALNTAREIMSRVIRPALLSAGLPSGAVVLLDSVEHAAGWALFSDSRLSLAVARGSGSAVSELGSIAQQSGVAVSLHGTGGAWMLVGESANAQRLSLVVEHSLDRKVCNTLNVVCIVRSRAEELVPIVVAAAERAANNRGATAVIHSVTEKSEEMSLATEFEWEENPEFDLVVIDDLEHGIRLFNSYSPQFVVSVIAEDDTEQQAVWDSCNAPFFGDGFTRWVDGQFALLRPELGLSNWENGRLFARSGILSGDSAFTVRLKVTQTDEQLHR